MSLKEFIATFYGKEIYLDKKKLQQEKIRNARAKNQMVFLYKCLSNHFDHAHLSKPPNAKT